MDIGAFSLDLDIGFCMAAVRTRRHAVDDVVRSMAGQTLMPKSARWATASAEPLREGLKRTMSTPQEIEAKLRKCLTDEDGYDYIYDLLQPAADAIALLLSRIHELEQAARLARVDQGGW